jgi:(1->4)-alpha-D-glucan 1-alpha-D-glucosylmutase
MLKTVALRVAPVTRLPYATYRFQFHADFPFSAAQDLVTYLRGLGVSHVYSSPILSARAGSRHGYDIVDYGAVNPELGGEEAFRELAKQLKKNDIGIILDIVPNHMAVGGADNAVWLDLLQNGRSSAYARWFDIDFDCPDPELTGKVHAPFLNAPYREVLKAGGLKLIARTNASGFAVTFGAHLFPIRTIDEAEIRAAGLDAFGDTNRLDALLARQNFVLDWWRNAGDRVNWRRFFDITELAAVRMEEPAAFEAAHAVVLRFYAEGLIDGVRVDHIDGLANPAAYCATLRQRLDELQAYRPSNGTRRRAWLLVEKILAADETLPPDWDVDGTTGYDFMNQVSALQHDGACSTRLAAHWAQLSGRPARFEAEEEAARREVLSNSFDGQRERIVDGLLAMARASDVGSAITRAAFRRATTSLMAHLRVYRTYATGGANDAGGGEPFLAALEAARREPLANRAAFDFIAAVMAGDGVGDQRGARIESIRRFNQLTAPLAAKAVEDTAFYRYGRLLSRNDVGFDAEQMSIESDSFHQLMQARARTWPRSMLATATHDHKRGEDVRARLAVISEMPEAWIAASRHWSLLNARVRPTGLDLGEEYQLYQMLVGAWPLDLSAQDGVGLARFAERMAGWQEKSLRESKLRSSWVAPDKSYEAMSRNFLAQALDLDQSEEFIASLHEFVTRIANAGVANSLVQVTLRCTVPGVPDLYQGTEFWDFSLVDPDNRRPVDFSARRTAMAKASPMNALSNAWRDGRVKQALLRRLLALRREYPELFSGGSYEPILIAGTKRKNALAFMRRVGKRAILVVATIRSSAGLLNTDQIVPVPEWWADTQLKLSVTATGVKGVIGPDLRLDGPLLLSKVLTNLPVAIWTLDLQ